MVVYLLDKFELKILLICEFCQAFRQTDVLIFLFKNEENFVNISAKDFRFFSFVK